MEALCKKEGGVKIYEKVVLPNEQFTQYGNPKFFPTWNESGGGYRFISKGEDLKRDKPTLSKTTYVIFREADQQVLGTYITYYSIRGYLPRLGPDPVKFCPRDITDGLFLKMMFVRSNQGNEMTTITQQAQQAGLALAAYANLMKGDPNGNK